MPKLKLAVYAIGCIICACAPVAFGAFNDIGIGARPLGLGGAFVALADDGNSLNYNAAGLGGIEKTQVSTTLAQRFKGLINYNYIAGVFPLGAGGTLGASVGILSEDSQIYKEQTLQVSYGKAFSEQLAIGVSLKSFGTSFDENKGSVSELLENNAAFFADVSAYAFSVDIGVIAKPATGLNIGFSAENLVPADLSVSDSTEDCVPINIRAGLAYSLAAIAESTQQESLREVLKSGLGLIEVTISNGTSHVHAGAEVWLNKSIGVRAGYGVKNATNSATTIALGGSAKIPFSTFALQLDYAFQILTGDLEDNTTQRVSLNLVF